MIIKTERLRLIPASVELAKAEITNPDLFAQLLNAAVPVSWPPETLRDALPYFLEKLEANTGLPGWFNWYSVLNAADNNPAVLIGSIGFFGPPDSDNKVETGYSVLPEHQGKGYATEMLSGLMEWLSDKNISSVLAHTDADNETSQKVLLKNSFRFVKKIEEENKFLFVLDFKGNF